VAVVQVVFLLVVVHNQEVLVVVVQVQVLQVQEQQELLIQVEVVEVLAHVVHQQEEQVDLV
jgi:hypothetical protein